MKIYLVGGAVRDGLLGLPVTEKDWVVVGATPDEMEQQGFRPVGKDFPVFLHPETREEYALARTERKSGHGYGGFHFHTAADVSLEDDLLRRDLTINAMARDMGGQVVDPFNGRVDLKARLLRHVSPAFAEDPLRVLRVARFAARYHWLGFRVADDTLALMKQLADSGELGYLVPERVWKETHRALMEPAPQVFFQVLHACGALEKLFPELAALDGVPQPEAHHPEIDTLVHQWLCLQQAARMGLPLTARYALLCHDLGKALTPREEWPRHIAHEIRSARLAKQVSRRLRVDRDSADMALLVAEYHTHCHRALELKPATLWKLLKTLDVLRRPQRLECFVGACEADARGRTGFEERPYPQADYLRGAARALQQVDVGALQAQGHEGAALGKALEQARLNALKEYKAQWQAPSP
ncbi:tRNA cytidylyltransferase [Alcanivorax hongdengensis A-11-3]|uniref:Multifunctional CCA protein n=1 Tax=Alcanivorax hongdengensis A-11-3 TaxID=1177179 RepID=L0WEP8_9GAMM|nr:multifunctional CCA addition/repair protein [Alcanivorax hongdengensis]EKF74632.1 tRNA cytidylyltransferase [Alcanivorax hongdengensis A-11-3]